MGRGSNNEKTGRASSQRAQAAPSTQPSAIRREVGGILLLALSLFVALSLGSLQLGGGRLMGPGGAYVALGFYALLGVGSWVVAIGLGVAAVRLLAGRPMRLRSWEAAGYFSATLFLAILLHLGTGTHRLHGYSTGGLAGEYAAEMMVALCGTAGAVLIGVTGLLLSLIATTPITASGIGRLFARGSRGAWSGFAKLSLSVFPSRSDEGGDDDRDERPARISDSEATRPMLAQPPRAVRVAKGEPNKDAAPIAAATGDTRRTRVVPPPGDDDTPLVIDASSLDVKGRRKKAGADNDVAAQQDDNAPQQSDAASHNTRRIENAATSSAANGRAAMQAAADGATRQAAANGGATQAMANGAAMQAAAKDGAATQAANGSAASIISAGAASQAAGGAALITSATTAKAAASMESPSMVPTADEAKATSTPPPVIKLPPARKRGAASDASPDNTVPNAVVSAAEVEAAAGPRIADVISATPRVTAAVAAAPETPEPIDGESERTDVNALPPEMLQSSERRGPPAITAPSERKPPARSPLDYIRIGTGEYRLPDIELLDYDESAHAEIDRQSMLDLAVRLEKTLGDYGVKGRVSEIHPGPVVTMYEFQPQAGTKLSKITALSNDLAMALEALKVRIVAPIPGKAAVGIEVPNRTRETVYFKEIVSSEAFARATKSKLAMALGKDIVGNPIVVDLAKMPHLLIAGTTGSGKSVSVNAMICSLLFNASPEEVKMIMIDPKMLELSIYEGIPHLLLPVVTDPKKANLALRWAVEEMERRYDLISKSGVRDIASYNKKVEKKLADHPAEVAARAAEEPPRAMVKIWVGPVGDKREIEVDANADAVRAAGGIVDSSILDEISASCAVAHAAAVQQMELAAIEPEKKLPYIVIVIDEFADLMMVASKEVEQSVARIAQKARAAGIHLMLATQRPSVDVITGLIKANFPSRIAFQVASRIDARTILDQQGAESLLGMGDMLFSDRGLALKRIHGPLVTDGEIHKVVDFLKAQGKPVYDLDILKPRAEDGEEGAGEEDMSDEMYDQAVTVVSEMRQASTSMLQRRLRLGYNRAARMIERMEREGIVGPADGARPREVLVHSHAA